MNSTSPDTGSTGLLLITSGRLPYLRLCIRSLRRTLPRDIDHVCLVDTSRRSLPGGIPRRARNLGRAFRHLQLPGAGLKEAVNAGWEHMNQSGVKWVLHVEEDFLFLRKIDMGRLVELAEPPQRCQGLLVRQRWYANDFRHASMLEYLEAAYGGERLADGSMELRLFSFNPSVYSLQRMMNVALTLDPDSEENFEMQLSHRVSEMGLRAAVDTAGASTPAVLHLGAVITTKHNALSAGPPGMVTLGYAGVHGRRLAIVAGRLIRQSLGNRN